ncbi:MAG: hypothetical protein ACM3YF_01910 [Candidatus Zixiibacteriota bacterium]
MGFCKQIVDFIEVVLTVVLEIVTYIVETVCRWVSIFLTTIIEVSKKVCKWLPWPLNKVCNWVTESIEVVEEIREWLCEEVIVGIIIEFVTRTLTYIFYVLRWVCWVICLPLRGIDILLCKLGLQGRRQLDVCVKILTDNAGTTATTRETVLGILDRADELLEQCRIDICLRSMSFVRRQDLMQGVECGATQFFGSAYSWFEKTACVGSPKPLTLYFVDTMAGNSNACTIDGTSYVVLTDGANGATVVHELGHHAELQHRADPANIMFADQSNTKDKLTSWQCCVIRSCEFIFATHHCEPQRSLGFRLRRTHDKYERLRAGYPQADDEGCCGGK